ncbi:uncharacterized protein LOC143281431 [Babylonia areolata]|uniref:uncharacterized protein LOC143281431 n=1 Tax=Babylonia areolata TaxID=304850 RepID=UPI003FD5922D
MATSIPTLVGLRPGTIGSGTVLSLLKQGAKVVVATRHRKKFKALCASTPKHLRVNLAGVVGDVSTEGGVKDVMKEVTCCDRDVHHVVVSLGSWVQAQRGKPLVHQSMFDFNQAIRERVASHFLLLKCFIPYLSQKEGSSYTIITDSAGDDFLPHKGYTALWSIGAGARNALAIAALNECRDLPMALCDVHFRCPVHPKADEEMPKTDPFNIGHDLAGAAIASTITAGQRGKVTIRNRMEARALAIEERELM